VHRAPYLLCAKKHLNLWIVEGEVDLIDITMEFPPSTDLGFLRPKPRRLPRKEVIQPQLPLRLPCYDFVPITNPTLGDCLPCGLAHRLQVLSAFMT
jgi:hypothetical protein